MTSPSSLPDAQRGGAYRWFVVGLLFIAYVLSAIDARILSLIALPMQEDMDLSDTQLGLLQGFAFAITYAIAAIPVGWLVDRARTRNLIIASGITFWSIMTVSCGLARTFPQLFLARIGVGFGEAALSPTAYSLIADYFGTRKRALANSFYAIGYPVGGGLALILGGILLSYFQDLGQISLPVIGILRPWQAVFVIVGFPGLLVAIATLSIREPMRRELASIKDTGEAKMAMWQAAKHIGEHGRVYLMLIGTISLTGMLAIGSHIWYPMFLSRSHNLTVAEIGSYYGGIVIVCGVIGTLFGGWLSGRLIRSGRRDANILIAAATVALKAVPLVLAPLMPNLTTVLTLVAFATLIGQGAQGVLIAAIQDVTPNRMRGQVVALTLFSVSLIGTGLGAAYIGWLSDNIFSGQNSLGHALSFASATILPIVFIVIWVGHKPYRKILDAQ